MLSLALALSLVFSVTHSRSLARSLPLSLPLSAVHMVNESNGLVRGKLTKGSRVLKPWEPWHCFQCVIVHSRARITIRIGHTLGAFSP